MDEADLLVFVGCGAADVFSDGYKRGRQAGRVIVVDPDPQLRTHQHRVDLHLLASPSALLAAVADRLPPTTPALEPVGGRREVGRGGVRYAVDPTNPTSGRRPRRRDARAA